jgi:putative hydrolase of the HAD superfamily
VSTSSAHPAVDWDRIRLVAFDVDGTLYDQRGLRLCMLREMLGAAVRNREIGFIRILSAYRRIREHLGEALQEDFEQQLIARTAAQVGCSAQQVQSTAAEWLERRPLPHLLRYRYAHLPELFRGLRQQGRQIGIFSDYPARDKLAAMQLEADVIVSAVDADVRVLKPHPKGLQVLMSRAGVSASETILIGDRAERDGSAARAAQAACLLLSRKPITGWHTLARYDDPLFAYFRPA